MKRPEVKIVIPDVLKLQLVDDWENVTKNNQVSELLEYLNISADHSSACYRASQTKCSRTVG
jgi:hypothetical protein